MQSIQPEVCWVSRLQNILEPMLVMRFMKGVSRNKWVKFCNIANLDIFTTEVTE